MAGAAGNRGSGGMRAWGDTSAKADRGEGREKQREDGRSEGGEERAERGIREHRRPIRSADRFGKRAARVGVPRSR
ncbi:hypothetical protein GCM10009540_44650 [Streptomyces turgidiscabies]